MSSSNIRTTITLPQEVLAAADAMVKQRKAKSRNALIERAIRRELAAIREAEIDAAFAQMAHDTQYQAEARQIEAEFAGADWEVFKLGEAEV